MRTKPDSLARFDALSRSVDFEKDITRREVERAQAQRNHPAVLEAVAYMALLNRIHGMIELSKQSFVDSRERMRGVQP